MLTTEFLRSLIALATANLIPLMVAAFGVAVVVRALMFYVVKREAWFVNEVEKRVHRALAEFSREANLSFFWITKRILQNTYFEVFNLRKKYGRRRPDQMLSATDRLFLIQEGAGRAILDFLRQARYLRKDQGQPKFVELSKTVFMTNPAFGRLFGVLPMGLLNSILNLLPGMFVIGGIFGTFLGIVNGLPQLNGISVDDAMVSKKVIDQFLTDLTFSLDTSIVGIILSVIMNLFNTAMAPEDTYYKLVNKFTAALELVWNKAENNRLTEEDVAFMEARDEVALKEADHIFPSRQFEIDRQILTAEIDAA